MCVSYRGVSVLNQKTELQKAMEKHNDKKVLKEIQKEKEASLTPFQKALDERAQKLEQVGPAGAIYNISWLFHILVLKLDAPSS